MNELFLVNPLSSVGLVKDFFYFFACSVAFFYRVLYDLNVIETISMSADGGIGIHASLRGWCQQWLGGSSPLPRTTKYTPLLGVYFVLEVVVF